MGPTCARDAMSTAEAKFPKGLRENIRSRDQFPEFPHHHCPNLTGPVPNAPWPAFAARFFKMRWKALEPVLEAGVGGGSRDEMLEVLIDPLRLEAY